MTFDEDDHSDGNVDVEEADHNDDDGDLEKVPEPGVTTMLYEYPPTPTPALSLQICNLKPR